MLRLDARVVKSYPSELHEVQLALDQLIAVEQEKGKPYLVNFEFQTFNDYTMGERLLYYNILTRHQYGLDVASCVLYLYHDGNVSTSPFYLHAGKGEVIRFQYHTLELSKMTAQELIALNHQELLPLLPFTQGGTEHQVIEWMITELQAPEKNLLATVAYTIATLVLKREKNQSDIDWLMRRFYEMQIYYATHPCFKPFIVKDSVRGN